MKYKNKYHDRFVAGARGLHNALIILEYIREYHEDHKHLPNPDDRLPTIQQIMDISIYKSTGSIWPYIQMLENEGYILRNGKRKRYTLLKP